MTATEQRTANRLCGRAKFRTRPASPPCRCRYTVGLLRQRPATTHLPTLNPTTLFPIRILGIDPGLRVTGFGVIEKTGNRLSYLASGCIKTDATDSLPKRLGTIHAGLNELLARYKPNQAVIEIVFVNVNPQSTLLLGQARGAAITTLVAGGVEVAEYTALQVKQAVVGNGHADKAQVQHMVRRLLSLPGDPSPDAADALACAIAHAHGGQGMGALATKGYRMRNGRMIQEPEKGNKK